MLPKVLILFNGIGLVQKAFEDEGFECVGIEINPYKVHLSSYLVKGEVIQGDVLEHIDYIKTFEAVWASPPCQAHSPAYNGYDFEKPKRDDEMFLNWSLNLENQTLWVENVVNYSNQFWGGFYNAAQFLETPLQRRRRMIGGRFPEPFVYRPYKANYKEFSDICPPACMATEIYRGGFHKDPEKERRVFSKWYRIKKNRFPTLEDMALAQGFEIPKNFYIKPEGCKYTDRRWLQEIAEGIGNGVPVYMARAFAKAYRESLES